MELHHTPAWACPISLQHKRHVIVFNFDHGAEKPASYFVSVGAEMDYVRNHSMGLTLYI